MEMECPKGLATANAGASDTDATLVLVIAVSLAVTVSSKEKASVKTLAYTKAGNLIKNNYPQLLLLGL